jgi:hypothetical protein
METIMVREQMDTIMVREQTAKQVQSNGQKYQDDMKDNSNSEVKHKAKKSVEFEIEEDKFIEAHVTNWQELKNQGIIQIIGPDADIKFNTITLDKEQGCIDSVKQFDTLRGGPNEDQIRLIQFDHNRISRQVYRSPCYALPGPTKSRQSSAMAGAGKTES